MIKIKKILTTVLAVLLMFCMSMGTVGCSTKGSIEKIKSDDLIYMYENETNTFSLVGRTESHLDCWYVSPYYNKNEIQYFGKVINHSWQDSVLWIPNLENLNSLYLPYCMTVSLDVANHKYRDREMKAIPQRITLINNEQEFNFALQLFRFADIEKYQEEIDYIREFYFTPTAYDYHKKELLNFTDWNEYWETDNEIFFSSEQLGERIKICKANTAYMFNYENCPNDGYFFINDFEYGTTIETTPYEPIRDGYTFSGWYKESECINAWNFEKDTLPQTQYDEQEREIYQETKLYAKWIKE